MTCKLFTLIKLLIIYNIFLGNSALAFAGKKLSDNPPSSPNNSAIFVKNESISGNMENKFIGAIGASVGYLNTAYSGENTYYRFYPELLGYMYLPLQYNFYLRPGIRIGYTWQQPDLPSALSIEETSFSASAEAGLLYNYYLIPAINFGMGINVNKRKLKYAAPVEVESDDISGSAIRPLFYLQTSLGIPMFSSILILEPFFRYIIIVNDNRTKWGFGIETTVGF